MLSYFEILSIDLLRMILLKKSISSEGLLSLYLYFEDYLLDNPTTVTLGFLQKISDDKHFWELKDPDFRPSVGFNLDLYNNYSKCIKCIDMVSANCDATLMVYFKDIPTINLLTRMGAELDSPKSMSEISYTVVKAYVKSKLYPENSKLIIWHIGKFSYGRDYSDMFLNFFSHHIKMRLLTNGLDFTFNTPEEFLSKYNI
jgi:hypothetical protein